MVVFVPPVAALFVPGNRPDRFIKADGSGADAVILDLEDSVAPADKHAARDAVLAQAAHLALPLLVRINGAETPWHEDDLDALARLDGVSLMIPKAESLADLDKAIQRIGRPVAIVILIESALGLARLADLLRVDAVVMAAFGSVDFSLDIGCAHERQAMLTARSELVWRSRAASRAPPLDGVTTRVANADLTRGDAEHAAALGFGGKLAIHPAQIEPIRLGFAPGAEAVAWARAILAAAQGENAVKVVGEMVDRPVIARARLILSRVL